MKLVLDASVIIKWFVTTENEEHREEALTLFHQVRSGQVRMIQPVHWQSEVIAVLVRVMPAKVPELIPLLSMLEEERTDSPAIYQRAAEISTAYNHHLFDTLYHAVALEHQAVFVTDDRKYFNKVSALGSICLLKDVGLLGEL